MYTDISTEQILTFLYYPFIKPFDKTHRNIRKDWSFNKYEPRFLSMEK